jgi:O-antigen/teichoic acid export membrane protein
VSRLSVVRKNIISNIIGKGLSAGLSFIFVPFYLKYLGAEAYGLIGFYIFLQSIFMVADMGLSGAFSRETARLTALQEMKQQLCDLCRTFELVFTCIGFFAAVIIIVLAHPIAEYWIKPTTLTVETVANTICLIGVMAGLQFPFFIYQGGMQGLQRQTSLNILLVGVGLLRGLGALWILAFITPTIEAYFLWQITVSLIQVVIGYIVIWRSMPSSALPACFNLRLIVPLWRFAAGMACITLSGILLTQVDKLILSKMLTLENFGYYTLATVIGGVPGIISFSVFNGVYPRFTQLVTLNNLDELKHLYHLSCQILTVLLVPVGLMIAFFSKEIIFLWTGNLTTALNTYQLVSVMVCGSVLMGIMMIPYALQLSFAWTRIGLQFNLIALFILIPMMFWLVSVYGAIGACYAWVGIYLAQIFTIIPFMHRRILQREKWMWYLNDIGLPSILPLMIMIGAKCVFSDSVSGGMLIIMLVILLLAAFCLSAMSAPQTRKIIVNQVLSLRRTQLKNI